MNVANSDHESVDEAFVTRLNAAIETGGGVASIARKTGLSKGVLYKYLRGESDPSRSRTVLIARAAKVDMRWLAAGIGAPDMVASGFVTVPRYDVRLAAGDGAFSERAEQLDEIPFTSDFIRKRLGRRSVRGLMIFEAAGDSMEPTVADGDLVMADTNDTRLRDGVYAFTFGEDARVKRLRRLADGIEIRSDNFDLYPAEILTGEQANQLQIIGRVVWAGRTF